MDAIIVINGTLLEKKKAEEILGKVSITNRLAEIRISYTTT
jgi:hypothetical protein